jgi:hypothetical protein
MDQENCSDLLQNFPELGLTEEALLLFCLSEKRA